jgi:hypothetical protein
VMHVCFHEQVKCFRKCEHSSIMSCSTPDVLNGATAAEGQ